VAPKPGAAALARHGGPVYKDGFRLEHTDVRILDTRDRDFPDTWAQLCARGSAEDEGPVRDAASRIVEDVRRRGDDALLDYTERFDGWRPEDAKGLAAGPAEFEAAYRSLPPAARRALTTAAKRITAFHERERDAEVPAHRDPAGAMLAQITRPLSRVGLYAPGGTARYPSTVLMTAVPARVAGVREIVVCSPAMKPAEAGGEQGVVDAWTLAACHVAGVTRFFKIGGAQAIAALAYGTRRVPRVDKICGPGNAYVSAAKRLVYGEVDIDMIAGPTEIAVVADEGADPAEAASDLLAQAEHDVRAVSVLITPSEALARRVDEEVQRQLEDLPRRDIARRSVEERGALVVARDLDEAVWLADDFAPEHLALLIDDAERWVRKIARAGAIFAGHHTPEAVGDYVAGPSHVLPTAGTARFASPLSVATFRRRMSVLSFTPKALAEVAPAIDALATAEGLEAHARAVRIRVASAAARASRKAPRKAPPKAASKRKRARAVTGKAAARRPAARRAR
jgi:histidinol dehydrogenase